MGKITDKLPVYYGWAKQNKVQKREAIMVIFLNETPGARIGKDGKDGVTKFIDIAYRRLQTIDETKDKEYSNRVYTTYSIFMDDSRIKNSLDRALEINFMADKNNVSESERNSIRNALRSMYLASHQSYKEPIRQLELDL